MKLLAAPLIVFVWTLAFVLELVIVLTVVGMIFLLQLAVENKDPLSLAVVATRILWK